jgi:hypothetical protein
VREREVVRVRERGREVVRVCVCVYIYIVCVCVRVCVYGREVCEGAVVGVFKALSRSV